MRAITNREISRPFFFFSERAFKRDETIGYILDGYMEVSERRRWPVLSIGDLAAGTAFLFQVGIFGRICLLGEEYEAGPFWHPDNNDFIRHLFELTDHNLFETVDVFNERGFFSMNQDELNYYRHDIRSVLDHYHMFYLDTELPYKGLFDFPGNIKKTHGLTGHPFARENTDVLFRHVPIERVW